MSASVKGFFGSLADTADRHATAIAGAITGLDVGKPAALALDALGLFISLDSTKQFLAEKALENAGKMPGRFSMLQVFRRHAAQVLELVSARAAY
jgi:hypothetical protein